MRDFQTLISLWILRLLTSICLLSVVACSWNRGTLSLQLNEDKKKDLKILNDETKNNKILNDELITFNVVKNYSLEGCLKCHSKGKYNISTDSQLLNLASSVLKSIQDKKMPPSSSSVPPLNACEIKILQTWINNEQAQNATTEKTSDLSECKELIGIAKPNLPLIPKKDLSDIEANFTNITNEILKPKCYSCHSVETNNGFTVLEYMDGIKYLGLLGPTAEESKLYTVLIHSDPNTVMPPPDSGIEHLTEDELQFIRRWINTGANPN